MDRRTDMPFRLGRVAGQFRPIILLHPQLNYNQSEGDVQSTRNRAAASQGVRMTDGIL